MAVMWCLREDLRDLERSLDHGWGTTPGTYTGGTGAGGGLCLTWGHPAGPRVSRAVAELHWGLVQLENTNIE